ncbi:type I restriction endonuclease subunit R [Verrucomicrobiales bacterium BCK34]|nr:type I restriction endonuclease subunit R [Verrucomicrobiales bacterium BCK34]
MTSSNSDYNLSPGLPTSVVKESDIEKDFIAKLLSLKYTNRPDISDRAALEANFRKKFERLNAVTLTDSEFTRLLAQIITADVYEASEILRTRSSFDRDDGTPLTFTLVNIKDWCKNDFEVVSQLRINHDNSHHRYDVILLINGIPVTQVELKTLEVSPRRAMQQIVDYKKDPGNGYTNTLLAFMQLFIVSNRTNTFYFANNNNKHFAFDAKERFLPVYQWADRNNKKINHLDSFAESFLPKCHLGHMISRYMVLVAHEKKMLMMRPYQIYAVQDIVQTIHDNSGNGYIWHTTGSGKTLTSFKASTLLKDNPDIEKCLFVVDRKDLDRQTREEFNKFQENCVEENTNTYTLVQRLLSTNYADKVIVTTIQKLGLALDENSKRNTGRKERNQQTYKEQLAPLADKRIAIIFDECHRSQFGENHKAIKAFFPNSQLFGFTGTPIFEKNSTARQIDGTEATFKTTADIFEKELHKYTITHAIEDKNVLRFHVDYFKPDVEKGKPSPKPGEPLAKKAVIEAILERHDKVTASRTFNALFATASINDAIAYHDLFATIQQEKQDADPDFRPLNIACVFSPPAEGNKDVKQLQEDLPQEKADNEEEPNKKKIALEAIIAAYNARYGTNHSLTEFDGYYQDVQDRIKSQCFPNSEVPHRDKIDLTIVVDMLLTGFDSKYLNTLYVDKNIKHHGLIQAFSRTNRVINDTKPDGHILDFRRQQTAVDEAIKLFSGEHADKAKEIWLVDPAPVVIEKLNKAVQQLDDFMKSQGLACAPEEVLNIKGDTARAQFAKNYKEIQRLKTQLDQYTDLEPDDRAAVENAIATDTHRAFRGAYIDIARDLEKKRDKGGTDTPPEVDEFDFEFILFATAMIDYDYIMELVARSDQKKPGKQKMTREQLIALIASDATFADQRDQLAAYINQLDLGQGRSKDDILKGYESFKTQAEATRLQEIAEGHGLAPDALGAFVEEILRRLVFDGERLTDLMAPLELGWKDRRARELALMDDLVPLLNQRADGQVISGLSGYES